MTIEFSITGTNAGAIAAEVEAFLAEAFGRTPERRSPPEDPLPKRDGEFLAIVAIILALPGFINETQSLADRYKLAERVGRLQERLAALAKPGDTVTLSVPGQPAIDLITAKRDSVLDRLEAPAVSPPPDAAP
jgi:hypothetical protein